MIVFIGKCDVLVAVVVLSSSREGEVKRTEKSHLKAVQFLKIITGVPLLLELPPLFFFFLANSKGNKNAEYLLKRSYTPWEKHLRPGNPALCWLHPTVVPCCNSAEEGTPHTALTISVCFVTILLVV